MEVLWISSFAPYDGIGHGGGQNHNYGIKYIKNHTDWDITLLSVCTDDELKKLDLDKYGIANIIGSYNTSSLSYLSDFILDRIFIKKYGGSVSRTKWKILLSEINTFKQKHPNPDVVITHWTETSLLVPKIKPLFPNARFIAIEEDVTYQGYFRKYQRAHGVYRVYRKLRYQYLKNAELAMLKVVDGVIVLNHKDKKLLIDDLVEQKKILIVPTCHGDYNKAVYDPDVNTLLFWGAMGRAENYKSVIWFIKHVLPRLDSSYRLVVAGSHPHKLLFKYSGDRVIIKGYVESILPYFEHSLCLVAPLVMGAGIKTKVVEALSAGLPVLTNKIGEEGIGLTDKENYLLCENAEDYVHSIEMLKRDVNLRTMLSKNGRAHIFNTYNTENGWNNFIEYIENS